MHSPAGRLVPATLLIASSLTVMAGATIAPALPAMRAHFGDADPTGLLVRLVLTLPALVIAFVAPFAGYLVDRFGRRTLLAAAIVLYAVAGASGLVLNSLLAILAGRAMLGLAVAFIMTAATALIADIYLGASRARFMGLQAGSMALGGVVFLMLGGTLADVSWRAPFFVYLLALVVLPGVLMLREPARETSTTAAGTPDVAIPMRLLAGLYAIAFVGMATFYMLPTQVPFLIERQVGAGGFATGAALATATLTAACASFTYGRLRARAGHITITALLFAVMGVGYVSTGLATSYITLVAALAVVGIGAGLIMPNLNVWLSAAVPPAVRGRALGGLTTAVFLGQFISPIASQPVALRFGLPAAFVAAGAIMIAGAAGLLTLRNSLPRPVYASSEPYHEPAVER